MMEKESKGCELGIQLDHCEEPTALDIALRRHLGRSSLDRRSNYSNRLREELSGTLPDRSGLPKADWPLEQGEVRRYLFGYY